MNFTEQELTRVWETAPKEIQEHEDYAFVISWDWKDVPTEFKGFPVYRFRPIPNQTIYFMPNPMWKNCEYDENTNEEMP